MLLDKAGLGEVDSRNPKGPLDCGLHKMADPNAKRLVCRTKVWNDAMVAGSDHRVLPCVSMEQQRALPGALSQFGIRYRYDWAIKRIRRQDLAGEGVREAADCEFRKSCAEVTGEVEEILRLLLHSDNGIKYRECQTVVDETFTSIERYVSRSLEAVDVRRCIHKRATSKPLWDQRLSLLKRQRTNCGGWVVRIDGNRRK